MTTLHHALTHGRGQKIRQGSGTSSHEIARRADLRLRAARLKWRPPPIIPGSASYIVLPAQRMSLVMVHREIGAHPWGNTLPPDSQDRRGAVPARHREWRFRAVIGMRPHAPGNGPVLGGRSASGRCGQHIAETMHGHDLRRCGRDSLPQAGHENIDGAVPWGPVTARRRAGEDVAALRFSAPENEGV